MKIDLDLLKNKFTFVSKFNFNIKIRIMKKIYTVMLASLLLAACSNDDDEAVKVSSLSVLPATATVYTDAALPELALSVTPQNALEGKTVEWTSSAPEIITVNADGKLAFAVEDIEEAEKTVTITASVDGKSATSVITVKGQIARYEILDFTDKFGLKMLDKNVGAANVGDAGNYYQWGKNEPVRTAAEIELNAAYSADWAASGEGFSDWTVAGNTPCPKGWSVPSDVQVKAMADALEAIALYDMDLVTKEEYDAAMELLDAMKVPASGIYRVDKDGLYLPEAGYFWSSYSTEVEGKGKVAYAFENNYFPTMGKSNLVSAAMPVRCVKASAPAAE